MPWTGNGFGLALRSDFPLAGCPAEPLDPGRPVTRLELTSGAELRADWPRQGSEVISDFRNAAGRTLLRVDFHSERGFLMRGIKAGSFQLGLDGLGVRCAPLRTAPWRWQLFLVGRVLPYAATLLGMEALHASVVARAGRAIAISGPSGAGKSSVAAELVAGGAELLADDVASLELTPTGVLAHPAPGLANLRGHAAQRLGPISRRLGRHGVGSRTAIRAAITRYPHPLPLEALYVLERRAGAGPVRLLQVDPPDPRVLLGLSFVIGRPTVQQRIAQLDVCSGIAATTRLARLRVPADREPADVAARIVRDS